MGLRTVAVYSEADDAMHVALADEAVLLGPARRVTATSTSARDRGGKGRPARRRCIPATGSSPNAEFAQACLDAGLAFVGPTAGMMTAMGSKSGSKALMEKAAPLVPGYHGEAQDEAIPAEPPTDRLPGAGQGVGRRRRPWHARGQFGAELAAAITSAKREAKAAFGDRMLIRNTSRTRVIEVRDHRRQPWQSLSLWERDARCSVVIRR